MPDYDDYETEFTHAALAEFDAGGEDDDDFGSDLWLSTDEDSDYEEEGNNSRSLRVERSSPNIWGGRRSALLPRKRTPVGKPVAPPLTSECNGCGPTRTTVPKLPSKGQRRAAGPEYRERENEQSRSSDRRRRAGDPGYRVMRNFQCRVHQCVGDVNGRFQREFLGIEFGHGCRRYDEELPPDVERDSGEFIRRIEELMDQGNSLMEQLEITVVETLITAQAGMPQSGRFSYRRAQ
ncbi:hypothetical protein HPB52_006507 [Rhipicephalus sanguineus]|uniref:Uncharacterized protein n=1 Tax=Rhipicephalus sanguineus TaxID=34632 RepID=A0A9D4SXZ4_RHISA|nr:hypothetical protein HPB52_006507 [Rhipicephalus sanguineus]